MNIKVNRLTLLENVKAKIIEIEQKTNSNYISEITKKLCNYYLTRIFESSDVSIETRDYYSDKNSIILSTSETIKINDKLAFLGISKNELLDYCSLRENKNNLQRLQEIHRALEYSTQTDVTSSQYKDVFSLLT